MRPSGSAGLTSTPEPAAAHEHGGAPRRERREDATAVRDPEQPEVAEEPARADERARRRAPRAATRSADSGPGSGARGRPAAPRARARRARTPSAGRRGTPPRARRARRTPASGSAPSPVGGDDRERRDGRRREQVRRRHGACYEIKASRRESHSPSRSFCRSGGDHDPGRPDHPVAEPEAALVHLQDDALVDRGIGLCDQRLVLGGSKATPYGIDRRGALPARAR